MKPSISYIHPNKRKPDRAVVAEFAIKNAPFDRATVRVEGEGAVVDLSSVLGVTRVKLPFKAEGVRKMIANAGDIDVPRDDSEPLLEAFVHRALREKEVPETVVVDLTERRLRAELKYSRGRDRSASAYFALPQPHTYAIVTTTLSNGVAVMVDEGWGYEDFLMPGTDSLSGLVDRCAAAAFAGDRIAIETLRSFAVYGLAQVRARRAAEGRA